MPQLIENRHLLNKRFAQYRQSDPKLYAKVLVIAKPLKGKKVLHINATPKGGGVAEILRSQVNIERNLGIDSEWYSIQAEKRFFEATKKIHNLLQGQLGLLNESEMQEYLKVNRTLSKSLIKTVRRLNPDLLIIHDPQPLPLVTGIARSIPTILRLHVDLSASSPTLRFLRPMIKDYSAVVVSSERYKKNFGWYGGRVAVIPPAIDPLAEKNLPLAADVAKDILQKQGIDPKRPLLVQVSRFDKWKDPLGVVRAYQIAKKQIPGLQLALAGFFNAQDDPEAVKVAAEVSEMAKDDRDIFLFTDPRRLVEVSNDLFISALYAAADIVIQKSLKEGFGLTITEAMWKGKPVIAGDTEGPRLQIQSGKNGVLVRSVTQAAHAIVRLYKNPKLGKRLGANAAKSVRKKFLLPKFVCSNLVLYRKLLK